MPWRKKLTAGGLYLTSGDKDTSNQRRSRSRQINDPNLPNPDKQKPQEIMAYMDSDDFKQLSSEQRMRYFRSSGQKVMQYQIDTYFLLPEEEKTKHLDNMIDRMQEMRQEMGKRRNSRQAPQSERQSNPDRQRLQNRQDSRNNRRRDPSRMRAGSERGTPQRRAQHRQFIQALTNRAEQRGIQISPRHGR